MGRKVNNIALQLLNRIDNTELCEGKQEKGALIHETRDSPPHKDNTTETRTTGGMNTDVTCDGADEFSPTTTQTQALSSQTLYLRSTPNFCISVFSYRLRRDIEENDDYILVRNEVWAYWLLWYGGGPPLQRYVIDVVCIFVFFAFCVFVFLIFIFHTHKGRAKTK
jgi:hypothetical protein